MGAQLQQPVQAASAQLVQQQVQAAALQLAAGGLVAFPTETVYGLGARADSDAAVAAIFAAKGRPAEHPLIVHLAHADQALAFAASLSPSAQRLMAAFWPGPLTVIVPRRPGCGAAAAGGQNSIGLRVPAHPVALALLQAAAALGVAGVAAPSANRFGRVSPTTAAHVQQEFGPGLTVLDGGACAVGIESTIVDCTCEPPALLRPGSLTPQQLQAVLGQPLGVAGAASPRASGVLASHYAPRARVRLWPTAALAQAWSAVLRTAAAAPGGPGAPGATKSIAVYSRLVLGPALDHQTGAGFGGVIWRQMPADAAGAAHDLFAVLRELDAAGVAEIWVEEPPASPDWNGVRDRLQRAAA
jgi:L-threonylcarbamoyladenylate synthase